MFTKIARAAAAGAAVVALSLTAIGCGDDTDNAKATAPKAACDAAVQLGAAFGGAPQDPAEIKAFAKDTMLPIAQQLKASVPSELSSATATLERTFSTIADTGDPSAIGGPDFEEGQRAIGDMVHNRCGVKAIDVDGVEYAFDKAPDKLREGRVSVKFTNDGHEDHELVLLRRNEGVTDDLSTILHLPQDQMMQKATFVGVAYGSPGSTSYLAADLEPGTYFMLCSLPVGGNEGAEPHFSHGMQHTLTVS
jgi:hypothetical protein